MSIFNGVALVTGAASEGCKKIVIVDRDAKKLDDTELAIKETFRDVQVLAVPTDISKEEDIENLYSETIKAFGRVDYVVNGAGVLSNNKRSHESSVEEFDMINNVNYRGCWLSSRAAIRGSIVNIASQLGVVGRSAAPAYCGSKAAVISMTRCDAIDYSKDLIRVNAVCPGLIDTAMTRPQADVLSPAINIAPMGRMGSPQEVADCILFLASSKASFVQGSAMMVDGGYVIN
ncbi:2-(R)-hydroxypropyl-CoM dehydrogenase [Fusarium oxysporum f. sp. cubense race 1]|uniref:2-(R)-hydroxypropyl-CoM dehydrogenase n=1 Tax=Fusarium oxysporum f. sp. cubense (strain race 1) TaxID=1229664 RepID=N4UJE4_FUSC1|nr:2-(R)-hydroxypropyl-CoM dehydrogenase [Fusarium oxysporum f. sp. cubense race 1]